MRTFVINLDRSTGRLASISHHLADRGIEWERWPAVDGRDITDYDFDGWRAAHPGYNPTRSSDIAIRGWLGCLASHRSLAAHIASTWDGGPVLVLEDDARLRPDWRRALDAVAMLGDQCELFCLGYLRLDAFPSTGRNHEILGRVRLAHAYMVLEQQCAQDLSEAWANNDAECDESWWSVTERGRTWGLRVADQIYGRSDISGLLTGNEGAGAAPLSMLRAR